MSDDIIHADMDWLMDRIHTSLSFNLDPTPTLQESGWLGDSDAYKSTCGVMDYSDREITDSSFLMLPTDGSNQRYQPDASTDVAQQVLSIEAEETQVDQLEVESHVSLLRIGAWTEPNALTTGAQTADTVEGHLQTQDFLLDDPELAIGDGTVNADTPYTGWHRYYRGIGQTGETLALPQSQDPLPDSMDPLSSIDVFQVLQPHNAGSSAARSDYMIENNFRGSRQWPRRDSSPWSAVRAVSF